LAIFLPRGIARGQARILEAAPPISIAGVLFNFLPRVYAWSQARGQARSYA